MTNINPINQTSLIDCANETSEMMKGLADILNSYIYDEKTLPKDVALVLAFSLKKASVELSTCADMTELSLRKN